MTLRFQISSRLNNAILQNSDANQQAHANSVLPQSANIPEQNLIMLKVSQVLSFQEHTQYSMRNQVLKVQVDSLYEKQILQTKYHYFLRKFHAFWIQVQTRLTWSRHELKIRFDRAWLLKLLLKPGLSHWPNWLSSKLLGWKTWSLCPNSSNIIRYKIH